MNKSKLSRRDALKLFATVGFTPSLLADELNEKKQNNPSKANGHIVIVGGGLSGLATAARLNNHLENPNITIIEPSEISASYQAGQTLIAGGVWERDEIVYKTEDYTPDGVEWIKDKALDIDAKTQEVTISNNKKIKYDYLVVAAGVQLDYEKIKGLNGSYLSLDENNFIEHDDICSLYSIDGAVKTFDAINRLIEKAKKAPKDKKLTALFTHPDTAIKCGGAPKKVMFLAEARLREAGVKDKVDITFYCSGDKMFSVPEYNKKIFEIFKEKNLNYKFKASLSKIDTKNNIATFDDYSETKIVFDEDIGLEIEETIHKDINEQFDFIHVTPPMSAVKEIANSSVGSRNGWIPVNKKTLQHLKYKNVFSLGDIAAIPMGKTGGSARKQYKVLVENLIAKMENKPLPAKYDGYTVCPIITDIGKVLLAEFDWSKKPKPSFPLDPTQERWIWWLMKVYLLKPMTTYGMLSGRL